MVRMTSRLPSERDDSSPARQTPDRWRVVKDVLRSALDLAPEERAAFLDRACGTVYLARDVRHDRQVALKVLHPDLAAALGAQRFLAEIRTTAALQHPHILPLFDLGETGARQARDPHRPDRELSIGMMKIPRLTARDDTRGRADNLVVSRRNSTRRARSAITAASRAVLV